MSQINIFNSAEFFEKSVHLVFVFSGSHSFGSSSGCSWIYLSNRWSHTYSEKR